jgi:hypothetical protein
VIVALAFILLQDKDWFPVQKGTAWTYVEGTAEVRVVSRGTVKVGDIECWKLENEIGQSDSRTEYYAIDDKGVSLHRIEMWQQEQLFESVPEPAIPRLKFGLKKGETWEWKGTSAGRGEKAKYTIEGEAEIEVAAGKYACVKVLTEAETDQGKYTVERWYAKGVGVVKQVIKMGDREVKRELKKYEKP